MHVFNYLQSKKAVIVDSSSSDDEQEQTELARHLSRDSDDEEPNSEPEPLPDSSAITSNSLNVSDYVLVAVHGKRVTKNYVASVMVIDGDEIEVDFLIQVGNQYMKPEKRDNAVVDVGDILLLLPPPSVCGGTKRTSEMLTFAVDLSDYNC